ncbi:MAG: hypothetical protein ACI8SR_002797 [Oceanicoccus sp.]|jgi:uncharacterized protein (DUF58 family)
MLKRFDKIGRLYERWLKKRLPLASEIQLSQKRIFIFPNKVGFLFLTLLLLLLVTGINYQNNLILSVGFIMISLFVTTIVATYQNLSSLIIKTSACESCFSGETVSLPLTFLNPNKTSKIGVFIGFDKKNSKLIPIVQDQQYIKLSFTPDKRGPLLVPRIKLFSVYPLGLLTCWSWLHLDFNGVVYPKPVDISFRSSVGSGEDDITETTQSGMDEFDGLKMYQKGDSLKRVAWRQYAKTQQLMTKQYLDFQGDERCLDWYTLTGFEIEYRLQVLCGWVIKAHEQNSEFSLKLPGTEIGLGSGEKHLHQCLAALALFQYGGNQNVS